MPDFYYTVPQSKIRLHIPSGTCILISAASACYQDAQGHYYLRDVYLPQDPEEGMLTRGAADCGGFVVAKYWGGEYRFSMWEYVRWLRELCPEWAALFDWVCVGLPATLVQEYQQRTHDAAWEMWQIWQNTPWAWVPTIQGNTIPEYERFAQQMLPFIHQLQQYYQEMAMQAAQDDTGDEDLYLYEVARADAFRVGIGGLCGRSIAFIREAVLAVQSVLGPYIPLHLWGVKLKYLQAGQQIPGVVSYDTAGFDDRKNPETIADQRKSGKSQTDYTWSVAQPKYHESVQEAFSGYQQGMLFAPDYPLDCVIEPVGPGITNDVTDQ